MFKLILIYEVSFVLFWNILYHSNSGIENWFEEKILTAIFVFLSTMALGFTAVYIVYISAKLSGLIDKIHGKKLSYNNYNDSLTAVEMIKSFREKPTTVIIKHANPCGVSVNKSAFKSYLNALKSDPVSAYGGILAVNYKISEKIAKEINKNFYEVVIADSINNQALKILKQKKNLRILKSNKFRLKSSENIKFFYGKFRIKRIYIMFNRR